MIIKTDTNLTKNGSEQLIHHLLEKPEDNEVITLVQGSAGSINQGYELANSLDLKNAVIHIKLSPDKSVVMSDDNWRESLSELGAEFGFNPDDATVVQHTKKGRTHQHIVVPAFDPIENKNLHMWRSKYRSAAVAYALEERFGHQHAPLSKGAKMFIAQRMEEKGNEAAGTFVRTQLPDAGKGWSQGDQEIAKRKGISLSDAKEELKSIMARCDGAKAFFAAAAEAGYVLKKQQTGSRSRWVFLIDGDPNRDIRANTTIGMSKKQFEKFMESNHEHIGINQGQEAAIKTGIKTAAQKDYRTRNPSPTEEESLPERITKTVIGGGQSTTPDRADKPDTERDSATFGAATATGQGRGRTISTGADSGRVSVNSGRPTRGEQTTQFEAGNHGKGAQRADREVAGALRQTDRGSRKSTRQKTKQGNRRQQTPVELIAAFQMGKYPQDIIRVLYEDNLGSQSDIVRQRIEQSGVTSFDWFKTGIPDPDELRNQINTYYARRVLGVKYPHLIRSEPINHGAGWLVTARTGEQFTDLGGVIKTPKPGSVQPQTANEIVKAAKARGWHNIQVTGTPEYKDEITISAILNGIETDHELSPEAEERLSKLQSKYRKPSNIIQFPKPGTSLPEL